MRFKIITSVFFIVLALQEVKAQSNFEEGYVITAKLDTLFGKIAITDLYSNSLYCEFRRNGSDSSVRYTSSMLHGYRFTSGKFYLSKNVVVDKMVAPLFLECLVKGKLDIYFFQDAKGKDHFFAQKDTLSPIELKYSSTVVNEEGRMVIHESKPYVGLLTYLTFDCKEVKSDISHLNELNGYNLIRFAVKYNRLKGGNADYKVYMISQKRKIKLSLFAGSTYSFLPISDINPQKFPSYGFNIHFQQVKRSKNFYIGIGLSRAKGIREGLIDGVQIPMSFYYINSKMGFSPTFSLDFDLSFALYLGAIRTGICYQTKDVSFFLVGDLKTALFIRPIAASVNFGVYLNLK